MTHDPILDGITRWGGIYTGDETMLMGPTPTGEYVLFSDLPALLAAAREDERRYRNEVEHKYQLAADEGATAYAEGQRDEREAAARVVEARGGYHSAAEFAAAIRAREEKPHD